MRRILCIHLPYLSTERVRRSGDSGAETERPLVLTQVVGASQVVVQVCPGAQALGLHPGMSLGQAQALVPQLVTQPADAPRDHAALLRLARWAIRFSPVIEPVAPHTLLVDVTGCRLLFGGEEPLVQQAAAGLERLGFLARVALADTVGAAWALATTGSTSPVVVPPGQTSAWLAPLPPSALRLTATANTRLDQLGVRTIADLLMLPRATLPARFGPELVPRLQQALGEIPEPLTALPPESTPVARRLFEDPLPAGTLLPVIVTEMLTEVFAVVRAADRALRRLELVLYFADAAPQSLRVNMARPSRAERHVAQLLVTRLERVDLSPGLLGLTLIARETSRHRGTQGALFEPPSGGDDEELGVLIDRLANRLGYEAVVRPQLIDDHQPEWAYRFSTVAETGCQPADNRDAPLAEQPRPVRLLPRPLPIRVTALVPHGPPTQISWLDRSYVIAAAVGPERIETAWWRGPDVRRDYFHVTTRTGERFWIFRALNEHRWYLHGLFG
jgi:protein ImuB